MTSEEFIGKCILELATDGVTVQFNKRKNNTKTSYNFFSPEEHGEKAMIVINYFDHYKKVGEYIIETFLHEYCHYRQWKDDQKLWKLMDKYYISFNNWLTFKKTRCPIKSLRKMQELELDCDRRAIALIKKYDLPIDLTAYIKQSNSYVLSYNILIKTRKFDGCSPYSKPKILALMKDTHLTVDELGNLPDGYEELYLSHLDK